MILNIYAVMLLAFYLIGIIGYLDQKKYTTVVGTGINVAMWMPFVGRALGWW